MPNSTRNIICMCCIPLARLRSLQADLEAPPLIQESRRGLTYVSITDDHAHIGLSLEMATTCCFTFPYLFSFLIYHHCLAAELFLILHLTTYFLYISLMLILHFCFCFVLMKSFLSVCLLPSSSSSQNKLVGN